MTGSSKAWLGQFGELGHPYTHPTSKQCDAAAGNHTHSDYLSKSAGGTLTGNLVMENDSPVFATVNTATNRFSKLVNGSTGATYIYNQKDTNNLNALRIEPETTDISQALQLVNVINGVTKRYYLMHSGCSSFASIVIGEYTGNGLYGNASPNSLTFSSIPQLLLIEGNGKSAIMVSGKLTSTYARVSDSYILAKISSNTIYWYSDTSYADKSGAQLNSSGIIYRYAALL